MLPGIRSLAVAMHLEIYWVYNWKQPENVLDLGIEKRLLCTINAKISTEGINISKPN